MMRVYLAGPMRGVKHYNFPQFNDAAARLRKQGHVVVNPADLDRKYNGFDAMALPEDHDWGSIPTEFDLDVCIRRDIEAVLWCDAVVLLDGWEDSAGAKAEAAVAKWAGKKVGVMV